MNVIRTLLREPKVKVVGNIDGKEMYRTLEPYSYGWDHDGVTHRIEVPAGFLFDGASIPALARPWFGGVWSLGIAPPLIHDWLYHWKGRLPQGSHSIWVSGEWCDALQRSDGKRNCWPRTDADRLFGRHMRQSGVTKFRRRWGYRAVRAAIWLEWNADAYTPEV